MSRKTTAALVAALGINFAIAGGALLLANLNKPVEYNADESLANSYSDIKQVAGRSVDAGAGDLAVALKAAQQGGNTRVTFTCGKDMGPAGREEHEGTWDQIAGAVLYRPEGQTLVALEAVFDTRSLRTDAPGLTNTVTAKEKWFDIDNHPTATFTSDTIKPADAATPSHTHDLVGKFTLNGITKPLTIPAKLSFSGQSLTLDASFTILRSDYKVEKRESSVAGSLGSVVSKVDDEVKLTVRVNASPDPLAVLSELAQVVEAQQERLRIADVERKRLEGMVRRIELLEEATDRLANSGAVNKSVQVDEDAFPKKFTDAVPIIGGEAPFEMVLVPGDSNAGVGPFYMSQNEVRWKMLRNWMEGYGLSAEESSQLINDGFHPSVVFGEPSMIIQVSEAENPAMAMSLRTAQAYCKWVSEKTGRRYRLPTIQEWQHALKLGGGVPADIDEYAWHAGNSPKRENDDLQITSRAGSRKPNAIGLHDMLGGVAEWVTNTGEQRIVVGGSIFTPREELTADWRKIEDVEVWSASYPQFPKSRYWYSDFYVTGIRLVCEPASVVANPPKDDK